MPVNATATYQVVTAPDFGSPMIEKENIADAGDGISCEAMANTLLIQNNAALYPQKFSTPGALRQLNYYTGASSHDQNFHQLAFYAQDDYRLTTLIIGIVESTPFQMRRRQTTVSVATQAQRQ